MRPMLPATALTTRIAAFVAPLALTIAACHASAAGAAEPPPAGPAAQPSAEPAPRVLVFSRTAGFRHASIPDGIAAVREVGAGRWETDATEDPGAFTDANLRRYRAVVFLSTTGDVLDAAQEAAFERFVRSGGGFAGIHAATDTEYGWPWYGKLVGARFATHPPVQEAVVRVEDREHPSTRMLPAEWRRTDEWYSFRENPRRGVHVLANLDERTYAPAAAAMGADHPAAWCHEFEGGRSWYTAGGHTKESFAEPLFRAHVAEGIAWAAGLPGAKAAPAAQPSKPVGAAGPGSPTSSPPGAGGPVLAGTALLAQGGGIALVGLFAPVIALVMLVPRSVTGMRAPVLALLLPGLGHLSLGYRRRGLLAMTAVLGMFASGLLVGGIDSVDSEEDLPWFLAQSFNGPVAYGADWANRALLKSGRVGTLLPTPPPADAAGRPAPGNFTVSSLKGVGAANEFGTLFIALGGLMNLVLAMDVTRRERADRPDR
jgi:type 1 glutamine amidotransferase